MNQNTFCIMAHKGLFVESTKHVKPCCVFKDFDTPLIYNENKSFDEIFNSPQFIDLREKMDNGVVHKGCENCFNGTINHRVGMNTMFFHNDYDKLNELNISNDYKSDEILYLDLRLSNLCNFKCRMCNASYSSSWEDDMKKVDPHFKEVPKCGDNWADPILDKLDKIQFLYLAGGEPLIMKETFQLLKLIENRKNEITLFLNTNLSNLEYKKIDVINEIIDFKKIHLFVSCDGFNEVGEYQRTGFNTDKFKSNLKTLLGRVNGVDKIHLDIIYALSAINIFNIFKFMEELKDEFDLNDNVINFQFVSSPWYLSVASGTEEFKKDVITFIKENYDNCTDNTKEQLNRFIFFIENNQEHIDKLKKSQDYTFIKNLDIFRNTDINQVSPWIVKSIFNEL